MVGEAVAEEVEEEVEAVEEEEEEAAVAQQRAQLREGEATQNSSEQNHPLSMETDKTSTGSSRTFKDICP